MTRNLTQQSPTVQPVISGDFRSPAVEPVPSGFDLQAYMIALCAEPVTVCHHFEYEVLRNHLSGPMDDHDTLDAQCQTCGQLISVTCFSDERVEYAGMDQQYAVRMGYAS